METKTKIQARADLLDAIDAYINTVIVEREKEIKSLRQERIVQSIERHRNDGLHIPDDARGPYAQCLRESLDR